MVAQNVVFYAIAISMGISALRVVTTKNVVHAALYLVVVLAGAAALYLLTAAEFVAVTQVLVYIGAIVVLFLFGIMLTRAELGKAADLDNDQRWLGAAVSVFLLGILVWTLDDAFGGVDLEPARVQTSAEVGDAIFQHFVIPFEVISVLLLAALVGSVVLARRD